MIIGIALTFAAAIVTVLLAGPWWGFAQKWITWNSLRKPRRSTLQLWRVSYVFCGIGFGLLGVVEIALVVYYGTPLL